MKLIFVHGINQDKKNSQQILDEWNGAIKDTPQGTHIFEHFDISAPFYGDLLVGSRDLKKGIADYEPAELKFKNNLAHEMANYLRIEGDTQTKSALEEDYFESDADKQKGFPHNVPFVSFARAVQKVSPFRGEVAMRFLGQAYTYYSTPELTKEVDAIVESAIESAGECVVVAHSLGTLVSYRALTKLGKSANVAKFVTLGSPLGLNSFRQFLGDDLARPAGVRSWLNAFDPRDFVSMGISLPKYYKNVDAEIQDVANTDEDPHSISKDKGYLHDERILKYFS